MITATSTPNIALIKYWGNRDDELRLPAADSLSMTLDSPTVEVIVELADTFSVHSDKDLSSKDKERFSKHWKLVNTYIQSLTAHRLPLTAITIRSHIPPGIGLASSAAVFSAVAKAYAELISECHPERSRRTTITDEQMSVIARLGSGSASRSIMGGFVTLENQCHGERSRTIDSIEGAIAIQIADEHHWPLHDIVIAPRLDHKKVGSTEGHHLAHTSPHFAARLRDIPRRQQECIDAILKRDFEKLQKVSEEDCLCMHRVMQTSIPPLNYLSSKTHRIVREVTALRESEHLAVLYTMDAGPTVHLVCTKDAVNAVKEFAHAQKNCTVFETKIGSGTKMLDLAQA